MALMAQGASHTATLALVVLERGTPRHREGHYIVAEGPGVTGPNSIELSPLMPRGSGCVQLWWPKSSA